MDARLAMASGDGERWQYIADALRETSERNERTAVILERLTVQLDSHDERITALERREEKATDRALDAARDEPQWGTAIPSSQNTLTALFNRVYTDWRVIGGVAAIIGTLVGGHLGFTWH